MSDWGHNELQADLYRTRRSNGEMTEQGVCIGPGGGVIGGRMDVLACKISWRNLNPTCYEVKVSRQDFQSSVQSGKYEKYLPWVRRFYFAAPAGMLKRAEIPSPCGLIVRSDKGWSGVVAPDALQVEDEDLQMTVRSLLMAHYMHKTPSRDQRIRKMQELDDLKNYAASIDSRVKSRLREAGRIERRLGRAKKTLARAMDEDVGDRSLSELATDLVDAETAVGALQAQLDKILRKLEYGEKKINTAKELVEEITPD